ncbi:MAG: hypothetical protein K0B16_02595 [Burkholderiaceae bacterium]|nr:hypothetical protein [Burkholderiaceae bacterium]
MRALHLLDSITTITSAMDGGVIVSGSHGGRSVVGFTLACRPHAVFFNDAGIGKERAGIVALDQLEGAGMIAAAYSCTSGRIGEAEDGWRCGVLSAVNELAKVAGLAPGQSVGDAVEALRRT